MGRVLLCETNVPVSLILGQSLYVRQHDIDYLDLAFAAKKGQKRLMYNFKLPKDPVGVKIQSQNIKPKMILTIDSQN